MKLRFIVFLFLSGLIFSVCNYSNAQTPDWLWAKSMGKHCNATSTSIVNDASGNIVSVGYFSGIVDFDPGIETYYETSTGMFNTFIAKLSSSGNFVWVKVLRGTQYIQGHSVTIDLFGNIFTTGYFTDTADFDPDSIGVYNLATPYVSSHATFVLKLDSLGNFLWVKAINETSSSVSISLDVFGNIYTSGTFGDTIDFDTGPAIFNLFGGGIYLLKLDNDGNFVWAKAMSGLSAWGGGQVHDIGLDALCNVYTIGFFRETVDFDPGPGVYELTADTSYGNLHFDIFISKLDSSGNFIWASRIGGNFDDFGKSLALDELCNIYITGFFRGTVDFDPDSLYNFNLLWHGADDIFISKFDSSGDFIWAKGMGGSGNEQGNSIALDDSANVYTTGFFRADTIDFNPDSLVSFSLGSAGLDDIFISKLDFEGNFVWALAMGGSEDDISNSVTLDDSGNVFIAGGFQSNYIQFGLNSILNGSGQDIFIAKLNHILTGIDQLDQDNFTPIHPNPATTKFLITNNKINILSIDIVNLFGGKVWNSSESTGYSERTIDVSDLPPGIYFVCIRGKDFTNTKKLIIAR